MAMDGLLCARMCADNFTVVHLGSMACNLKAYQIALSKDLWTPARCLRHSVVMLEALAALAWLVPLVWAPVEASHMEWEESSTSRAEQFDSTNSRTLHLHASSMFGILLL